MPATLRKTRNTSIKHVYIENQWKNSGGMLKHVLCDPAQTGCKKNVDGRLGNATNIFHHLKRYYPSDITKSTRMRSHVNLCIIVTGLQSFHFARVPAGH